LRKAIDALADFLAKMISNPGDMRRAFDLCREQRVRRKRATEPTLEIVEMPFETALAELEQIIDGRDDRLGLGAEAKGRSDCAGFR
jgi:hypothetical protein